MSKHRLFGIRHHGPGCAKALAQILSEWQPDLILLEGPPDADEVLHFAGLASMEPPVALMLHSSGHPGRAAFYPFATFSPEWQAIRYGLTQKIPIRFMDLPYKHRLMLDLEEEAAQLAALANSDAEGADESDTPDENPEGNPDNIDTSASEQPERLDPEILIDPMNWQAKKQGYDDAETWWEHLVEQRQDMEGIFEAIAEAMTVFRGNLAQARPDCKLEALREAWMRRTIRAALKEGYERVAVICGAWHVPALIDLKGASQDQQLLKGLASTAISATWIPWSYGRLAQDSGYGAGINAPGWYDFLFRYHGAAREEIAIEWLARVAEALRQADLDVSSAQLIDAARLANTLAAMRGRSLVGLSELDESVITTICMGERSPLDLVSRHLLCSERLGAIPEEVPQPSLAQDLSAQQKRLRLKITAAEQTLELDLRKDNDLARSILFHRLNLLGLDWASLARDQGRSKGTFREVWTLQWDPQFASLLVERAAWGETVALATTQYTQHQIQQTSKLRELAETVSAVMLADLGEALPALLNRLQTLAASSPDLTQLLQTLPPLASALRYGNVRRLDLSSLETLVSGLVVRICIVLPLGCRDLDEEAAEKILDSLLACHESIQILDRQEFSELWLAALNDPAEHVKAHPLLAGRATRILMDLVPEPERDSSRIASALSPGNATEKAAAWLEGFLRHAGMALIHDERFWATFENWLLDLNDERFVSALPLLRRTFAGFSRTERHAISSKTRQNTLHLAPVPMAETLDPTRAAGVIPFIAKLLGIHLEGPHGS